MDRVIYHVKELSIVIWTIITTPTNFTSVEKNFVKFYEF